jgi:cyclophilin family peptidyl-prolyl cis-trans isomerase/photosystem II stability/assembly factor-like uncharacterized protein
MVTSEEGWAVGDDGTVLHFVDGLWQSMASPTGNSLWAVDMVGRDDGWIVGQEGLLLRWQGVEWSPVESPTQQWLLDVRMLSPGEGLAAGTGGTILQYVDGTWSRMRTTSGATVFGLDMVREGDGWYGWAVGSGGTILRSEGGPWSVEQEVGASVTLHAVDMMSTTEGWAVGEDFDGSAYAGVLLHYEAGTWSAVGGVRARRLFDVAMVSMEEGWAVGEGGILWHTDGGEWRAVPGPNCFGVGEAVTMLSPEDGWVVGHATGRSGALILRRIGGGTATPWLPPPPTATATATLPAGTEARSPVMPVAGSRPLATLEPAARVDYYNRPPEMQIDITRDYRAVLRTAVGDITLDLLEQGAPETVNNFVVLAQNGFFDDTTFHRVLEGFVAQGGDPGGQGIGGPGYEFADEFDCALTYDQPGRLGMANGGPDTNGSQFFITYVATPHLDGAHSLFGQLIDGMDVLLQLKPRDPAENPTEPGTALNRVDIVIASPDQPGLIYLPMAQRE